MTKQEAINTVYRAGFIEAGRIVNALEALGLIKFDEPKEVENLFEFKEGNCQWTKDYRKVGDKYGVIRLEQWPEGLVLWVGGEIKWKSWEQYYKIGDRVNLIDWNDLFGGYVSGIIKGG